MTKSPTAMRELSRLVYTRGLVAFLGMGAIFFVPAGTLAYWQAWVYMGVLLIPMFFVVQWLLKNSPELLERRMKFRERERTQSRIQTFAVAYLLLAFTVPGLDQRFGWSTVPPLVTLVADVFVFLGYSLVIRCSWRTSMLAEQSRSRRDSTSSAPDRMPTSVTPCTWASC